MEYGDERSRARKRRQSYVKHTMEYPEGTMLARKCTLAGEIIGKWVKGFRFKPYKGPMPTNPFKISEQDGENPDAEIRDIGTYRMLLARN